MFIVKPEESMVCTEPFFNGQKVTETLENTEETNRVEKRSICYSDKRSHFSSTH